MGLVTGPHARIPPNPQPVGSGPRQPAQRAGSRGWESARPRRPHTQAGGAPPRRPCAASTARKGSSQERALWGWRWDPTPASPRTHSQWVVGPGSPPRGRAAGVGGAPDPRRPSQRRTASLPGTPFCHHHGAQCRPARACAVGPVLGPHTRTDRTRDTRVTGPRLPAPEDGRPGEGQRLTPDAPHNSGRPTPPGTAPHRPHGRQPPQGNQARGTVLGPHTHTPAPTTRGWRTPTARPVGGQSEEGERLTSDAPHNGGSPPPPRDALPPPPQRAMPARKGARCVVGAGSTRPHRPHPGHTGHETPAARPRGRAAGGGTAPDTRRPSQRWQARPPRGQPPTTPTAHSPHRACRPRAQCRAPTTTHPRPQHVGCGHQQPAQWAGSWGRGSA